MLEFSENQRKAITSGLTALALVVVFAFVGVIVWLLVKLLAYASPAVVPVVLGFFLALFFRPYYRFWHRVLHNPTAALIVMLLTVFVPLGFLLWYAGALMIDQLVNLIKQGPELVNHVVIWFRTTFPKLHSLLIQMGVPDNFGDVVSTYGSTALRAGSGALKAVNGVVTVLASLIFFVFFLITKDRRGAEIVSHVPIFKDDTRSFLAEQLDAFTDILVSFFQRQAVICLIEGVLYGTGFWLVGLPYGFLIGFMLGVLNLIPLFGSLVCLPVALPLAYFPHGGSLTRLILVLVVWCLGQLLDGYFITPKIQGNKTGLGYAGVLFSFILWASLLGPLLGMLLAIPLSAFCVVLGRALKAKYIKPLL